MSATDPSTADEGAAALHDALTAAGQDPQVDDLRRADAFAILFRQWLSFVAANIGGGGGPEV